MFAVPARMFAVPAREIAVPAREIAVPAREIAVEGAERGATARDRNPVRPQPIRTATPLGRNRVRVVPRSCTASLPGRTAELAVREPARGREPPTHVSRTWDSRGLNVGLAGLVRSYWVSWGFGFSMSSW